MDPVRPKYPMRDKVNKVNKELLKQIKEALILNGKVKSYSYMVLSKN